LQRRRFKFAVRSNVWCQLRRVLLVRRDVVM
jgi:hypothetical protein